MSGQPQRGSGSAHPLTLGEVASALSAFGAQLQGDDQVQITDVCQDSRAVVPGALFVARKGERSDGTQYATQAVARGAVALLLEHGVHLPELPCPQLRVSDLRRAMGFAAEAVHHNPSQNLALVGITGTNGKTTITSLLTQCLQRLGQHPLSLGTLGITLQGQQLETGLTTAESDVISRVLAQGQRTAASHALMEVSSHALDQGRVDALQFAVAAFTNLTQDHLDYHGDMASYGAAKARLFTELKPRHSVINAQDAFGRQLLARALPGAIAVGRLPEATGPGNATAQPATPELDIGLYRSQLSATHSQLWLATPQGELTFNTQLLGEHNVDNWLVTLGILHALGVPLGQVATIAPEVHAAPGRLQRVNVPGAELCVLVDYAHTPDALERVLQAAQGILAAEAGATPAGKLWCVFGCGGDRDRTKRPLMGAIAARYADYSIITNDNPRTEQPEAIAQQIEAGLRDTGARYSVCLDREQAIAQAVAEAASGDVVVIAGKGHENYQIIGQQKFAFDDAAVAQRWLQRRVAGKR